MVIISPPGFHRLLKTKDTAGMGLWAWHNTPPTRPYIPSLFTEVMLGMLGCVWLFPCYDVHPLFAPARGVRNRRPSAIRPPKTWATVVVGEKLQSRVSFRCRCRVCLSSRRNNVWNAMSLSASQNQPPDEGVFLYLPRYTTKHPFPVSVRAMW